MAKLLPDNTRGLPRVDSHTPDRHRHQRKAQTWLTLAERTRLDRVLRRRQQNLREFLTEAITIAESQLPMDGERVRTDVPRLYAWMAVQVCQAKADEWEQLATVARQEGEVVDASQYRKAWGDWLDATAFFSGILQEYDRRQRRAGRTTSQRPSRSEN